MSIYRTYFLKNNTITKDSYVNTAKNPATEIRYGSSFTKFILQLDIQKLKNKVTSGDVIINSQTKHYLHLTNCIFGDEDLKGDFGPTQNVRRATSFDLIVFKILQDWDEGVGYEYSYVVNDNPLNKLYSESASNWFKSTTISGWTSNGTSTGTTENGIYSTNISGVTTAQILSTQHFDNGDEHLHVDITNYINDIVTGTTKHYGIGVAFSAPYELITAPEYDEAVSFFTKYTQTFFEPYLETEFNDYVIDNRNDFFIDTPQKLCIYTTQNGRITNLDSTPTVDLMDGSKVPMGNYTGLTTTKVAKGTYCVAINLTGITSCENKLYYYDKWKNLMINGKSLEDQTLKFVPKDIDDSMSFTTSTTSNSFFPVLYGVKRDEKVISGEVRKITVDIKQFTGGKIILEDVYYRMYVREGNIQIDVIDWTKINKTATGNQFFLDTSFLIPREYYIDVKVNHNGETSLLREQMKFKIVSER